MRKRLDIFGEVGIIDEMDGFGLDFVRKTGNKFLEHRPRHGSSTLKEGFGTYIQLKGEKMRQIRGL